MNGGQADARSGAGSDMGNASDSGRQSRSPGLNVINPEGLADRSDSPSRPPTSAEIDAVIAAAMANAPPDLAESVASLSRSNTPLMTNLLPAAVGADGRVNLFVGNLPYRVRWQDVKDLFRKAGTVLRADVSLGQDNRSRGYGTVLMGSREDAARAIDRFNGFMWQTRTLEVRPDRLPPEYEPQPIHHAPPPPQRAPMFPYIGAGGPLPPHLGPGHPHWHPPNHRPPMSFNPGLGPGPHHHHPHHHHPMTNHMTHPGMSLTAHPPPHLQVGPPGRAHSPAHFGPNGVHQPLSNHNTGSQSFGSFGASPLAGSLTVGADPLTRPDSSHSNTLGPSPHLSNLALPRGPSPAGMPGPSSRPASSQGNRSNSSGGDPSYPPHALSGHLPPAARHPQAPIGSMPHRPSIDQGYVPHLEGLAQKRSFLGPPETLHDRVVFVSNMPLSMQWQDLKDWLRPAGHIVRADVASGADGRSKGFGTALFGAEEDALRAVHQFNGREIEGHRLRVYLERDSHHHDARRPSQSQTESSSGLAVETTSEAAQTSEQQEDDVDTTPSQNATPSQARNGLASRVPWNLHLDTQATPPSRPPPLNIADSTPHFRSGFPHTQNNGESTPHFRNVPHPGHIAMPAWPGFDMPTPGPLSPLQTRGLPPMTPSMPGFVFNNPYPDTPPVPHHFLGPFSPGIPVTSPNGFAYNPFLNPAPGAPVHRPPMGGSAQLGTPTTQSFPANSIRGAGPPGAPLANEEYFPSTSGTSNPTSPALGARSISQSVLNARDRLAPSGPNGASSGDVDGLASAMTLHSLSTGQETPPSPTSGKQHAKAMGNGIELSPSTTERQNNAGRSSPVGARTGRFSLDDQRPTLDVESSNSERRASFGDTRK